PMGPLRSAPPGPPPMGAPPRRPGPAPAGPGPRPGPPRPTMAPPRPQPRRDVRDDYEDEDEYDDEYEPRRRVPRLRVLIAAAVLAVVAAGGGALLGLRNGGSKPYWVAQPEAASIAPVLGGLGPNAKQPAPAALAAALAPLLTDARLGPRVTASVVDVASGPTLFESGGAVGAGPASPAKLVTDPSRPRPPRPAY